MAKKLPTLPADIASRLVMVQDKNTMIGLDNAQALPAQTAIDNVHKHILRKGGKLIHDRNRELVFAVGPVVSHIDAEPEIIQAMLATLA